MWEITFVDSGETEFWTTYKCNKYFGEAEFAEIAQGYAPHIVAIQVS